MRFWAIKYNTCWVGRLHFPRHPGFGSKLVWLTPRSHTHPFGDGEWMVWAIGERPGRRCSQRRWQSNGAWSIGVLYWYAGQAGHPQLTLWSVMSRVLHTSQNGASRSTVALSLSEMFRSSELVSVGERDETSDIYRLEIFLLVGIWEERQQGTVVQTTWRHQDASLHQQETPQQQRTNKVERNRKRWILNMGYKLVA